MERESDGQVPFPQALPRRACGAWVRDDGEGRPPVTDGPFAETKDLIAGFMIIDGDWYGRALAFGAGYAAGEWMKTIGTKVGTVLCGA